jgi:hypothetical protein
VSLISASSADLSAVEARQQGLRRWINFFYECAAVSDLVVAESDGHLTAKIRLHPGNERSWLNPHLHLLTRATAVEEPLAEIKPVDEPLRSESAGDTAADVTTLQEVLNAILEVEKFNVEVRRGERKVRGDLTLAFPPYRFKNRMKDSNNVKDWRDGRFLAQYDLFDDPEYVIHVLDGSGFPCAGQTKLRTVRESYS